MITVKAYNVNPAKLTDEICNTGLKIIKNQWTGLTDAGIVSEMTLYFDDSVDVQLVQQVINTHEPTPIPLQPTELDYLLDLDYRLSKLELGL